MTLEDAISCRGVSIRSGMDTGRAIVLSVLSALPFAMVLARGAWSVWSVALAVAGVAWLFVIARTRRRSGYVLELLDSAIRIRAERSRWRVLRPAYVVTASSVEDGYLVAASHIVLRLRNGNRVTAELAGDDGQRVLDHLGLTLERRALSAPLTGAFDPSGWVGVMVNLVVLGAAAGLDHLFHPVVHFLLLAAALGVACTLAFSQRVRPRVEVGVDGVRIAGAVRSRFVPYARIESVARSGDNGDRIVLHTSSGTVPLSCIDQSGHEIAALVARIEERRAAAAGARTPPIDLLDRRGRPLEEWRDALSGIALAEAGFRGPALCESDLDDVLADPGAPLDRRLGAALALRSCGTAARARIRVAAERLVERRARVALEAAAAEDIDDRAMERALDKPEPLRAVAVRQPHESED